MLPMLPQELRRLIVLLHGNQQIDGVKKFRQFPFLPPDNPAEDYHAATKKYVDDRGEREISFPIRTTNSISVGQTDITFGRPVVVQEAFAVYTTGSLSSGASCSIGIFKGTLSTRIGSINISQSAFAVGSTLDCIPSTIQASMTSTSFTSTDILCIAMDAINLGNEQRPTVYIRYRENN